MKGHAAATILPRSAHGITRRLINPDAITVLHRLRDAGYDAMLVGGCVRDLMLGRSPKDFDVATDASPEQVRKLFRNSRLIGRRFRLAHVFFGREIIEVATYRAAPQVGEDDDHEITATGQVRRDNVFGNQAEDAVRRDFTVNALYYNIADKSVVDYVGGIEDLKRGVLRVIGDPATRLREDPVRMLRAVRFAAKLGFKIDTATRAQFSAIGDLLRNVSSARLFDECLKLFHGGQAASSFSELRRQGLFGRLFPRVEETLARPELGWARSFVEQGLANTDQRVAEDKPVNPAFLFAVLLWPALRLRTQAMLAAGKPPSMAMQEAGDVVTREQLAIVMLPKRYSVPMREIWQMQARLERRLPRMLALLTEDRRFRAAYDFLLLRAQCGDAPPALADWWTRWIEASPGGPETETARQGLLKEIGRTTGPHAGASTDAGADAEADMDASSGPSERKGRRRRSRRRRSGTSQPGAAAP